MVLTTFNIRFPRLAIDYLFNSQRPNQPKALFGLNVRWLMIKEEATYSSTSDFFYSFHKNSKRKQCIQNKKCISLGKTQRSNTYTHIQT